MFPQPGQNRTYVLNRQAPTASRIALNAADGDSSAAFKARGSHGGLCHVLVEGDEGGMIEIAFSSHGERIEELAHQGGQRQRRSVFTSGRKRDAKVLAVQI